MPRTTQNFLDITDTRLDGQLTVELWVRTHGHTVSVIKLNDWLIKENHTTLQFDLFAPLLLTIDLVEFTEGSSGVEVELFTINDFEILPRYKHLASTPTNYIDKLGRWHLEISSPFYTWYHEVSGQGWIA